MMAEPIRIEQQRQATGQPVWSHALWQEKIEENNEFRDQVDPLLQQDIKNFVRKWQTVMKVAESRKAVSHLTNPSQEDQKEAAGELQDAFSKSETDRETQAPADLENEQTVEEEDSDSWQASLKRFQTRPLYTRVRHRNIGIPRRLMTGKIPAVKNKKIKLFNLWSI